MSALAGRLLGKLGGHVGTIMMAGMVIGGIAGAIKNNSASAVTTSCANYEAAANNLKKTQQTWHNMLLNMGSELEKIKSLSDNYKNSIEKYKTELTNLNDLYRKQELQEIIMIISFIISIVITILVNYTNLIDNIWNFIVN